jgi:hypothetical protein
MLLCLQDDDCQELLDGPGHPGCTSGPLAYDLTQHTGSYMYMAPVSDHSVMGQLEPDVFHRSFSARGLYMYMYCCPHSPLRA